MGAKSDEIVLVGGRKGHTETQRRMPRGDRGRDGSDASTVLEMSRVGGSPQKTGESVAQMIASEPPEGTAFPSPVKTLTLLFRHQVCDRLSWQRLRKVASELRRKNGC